MQSYVSGELEDITQRLNNWSSGDHGAENELFEAVFPSLRRLAQCFINRERDGYALEPAELVNQIYFRLAAARTRNWQNRQHFFALAARAMRQHLIDRARARGSNQFVSLEAAEESIAFDSDLELLYFVGWLLDQLAAVRPDWRELVELKYSRGFTDQEAAEAMRISLRSMQRMCSDARGWLSERADPAGTRRTRRRRNMGFRGR
jgi:RNA polymerase sigma factor (TIGR02999 family)